MIEKLERHTRVEEGLTQDIKISCPPEQSEIVSKINELVDTVNNIVSVQEKLIDSRFVVETKHEEPDGDDAIQEAERVDPFADQRKRIGKLCRFWNDDPNDYVFGKLKEITFAGCYIKESGFIYENCEPVKPDDDIIYKGEQDE